jgi:hypothetical protein
VLYKETWVTLAPRQTSLTKLKSFGAFILGNEAAKSSATQAMSPAAQRRRIPGSVVTVMPENEKRGPASSVPPQLAPLESNEFDFGHPSAESNAL